jgi:hypothetical protein
MAIEEAATPLPAVARNLPRKTPSAPIDRH